MHLHPVVLDTLAALSREFEIPVGPPPGRGPRVRPRARIAVPLADAAWWCWVFRRLRRHGERALAGTGIAFAERVYGLLATGRVDESYLLRLLPRITASCGRDLRAPGPRPRGRAAQRPPGSRAGRARGAHEPARPRGGRPRRASSRGPRGARRGRDRRLAGRAPLPDRVRLTRTAMPDASAAIATHGIGVLVRNLAAFPCVTSIATTRVALLCAARSGDARRARPSRTAADHHPEAPAASTRRRTTTSPRSAGSGIRSSSSSSGPRRRTTRRSRWPAAWRETFRHLDIRIVAGARSRRPTGRPGASRECSPRRNIRSSSCPTATSTSIRTP